MRSLTQITTQLKASEIDAMNNAQMGLIKGGTCCKPCGGGKTVKVKSIKVKSVKCKKSKKSSKKGNCTPVFCNPRPRPCYGW